MADIFISYAHEDQPFVRMLVPALEAEGFSVWWDHTIPAGKTWDQVIAAAIENAKACITIWSQNSVESDWVKEEATLARDGKKYLPIVIDDRPPPLGFRRIQAANLNGWTGDSAHPQFRIIANEARALLNGGATSGARTEPPRPRTPPAQAPRPEPEPARSSVSPRLLIAGVLGALALIGVLLWGNGERMRAQELAQAQVQAEEAARAADDARRAATDAEAVDAERDAELERLRREREELLAQNQAAQQNDSDRLAAIEQQRAEIEQMRRDQTNAQRAQEARAAVSLPGVWSGTVNWEGLDTITIYWTILDDGTMSSTSGERGTWSRSGDSFTVRVIGPYEGAQANTGIFVGTISNNVFRGSSSTSASSHRGVFEARRQ